jgi:hypothetical protein
MFTDEQLQYIYAVIKDTVFLDTMDPEYNALLMGRQNKAYEIMRSELAPLLDPPIRQPEVD